LSYFAQAGVDQRPGTTAFSRDLVWVQAIEAVEAHHRVD
jgi:hypothetical protein